MNADTSRKTDQSEKRLLILVEHMTQGGAERVLSELITYWRSRNIHMTIVETDPFAYSEGYSIPSDIEIIKIPTPKGRISKVIKTVFSLIRVMRSFSDTPVLAFNKAVIYKLALAMPFTRNTVILSERCDPRTDPPQPWRRRIRDWAFRRADKCVFQTPDAMNYFPDSVKAKGTVIPNPINPDIPERYEGEREKRIVAAGRLSTQKNFPMLLRAFSMLHRDFPDYRLVIYGRGDLLGELTALAKELGIADCVDFPGFSENIYEELLRCAVYVSSSDYEGISNSMLEALAMGIPSVVTDCPAGGAKMAVRDHENGILVPVGDAEAMYRALREVLSDPALAEAMGKEACRIREIYPVERIGEQWIALM